MPRRPRREAIHSHRDFPSAYAEIIRQFSLTHHLTISATMDRKAALATRNHFYRYVRWLSLAAPDDFEATDLREIAQTMKCRIVTEPETNKVTLEWYLSPIAEWSLANPLPRYQPRVAPPHDKDEE